MTASIIAEQSGEASEVLRILIVSLGGFSAGASLCLALRHLSPWVLPVTGPGRLSREGRQRVLTSLFLGIFLLAYTGVALLTTDHVYKHLVDDTAPVWQLMGALLSFSFAGVSLVGLFRTRSADEPVVKAEEVLQDPTRIDGPR